MATSFDVQETVSGLLPSLMQTFGRFRAHSSLRPHVQKSLVHHSKVGQCKQRHQVGRVLGQSPVFDLDVTELALDDPKLVFHLGPDAGLGLLQLLQDGTHRRGLVQQLALARHHGHVPVDFGMLSSDFFALLNTPIT